MTERHRRNVPFNGVDSLMFGLDEPDRPQTIELEVGITERLDEQQLRDAVAVAADRHPMARARQRPPKPFDLDYQWEIDESLRIDPVEVCTVAGTSEVDSVRDAFLSRHIDLRAASAFRVLLVHEPDGDRVMLSVNHAAFDGIGSIRLLQSISRAYAGLDDPLPAVDPIAARDMRAGQDGQRRHRGTAPTLPSLALPKAPARLASAPSKPSAGFGILHLDLDVAQAAPPAGATMNDVLVAALHDTIQKWNRSRGVPCDRITTMMPVNQRPPEWRSEVLANLVLPGQIQTTPSQRARPRDLLAAVTAQTKRIKAEGVTGATDALRTARVPVVLRGLLPHLVDAVSQWTADTAVLTNLGRIEDPPWFGGEGRGLWFGAPPRAPVNLTVGAAAVGERLGLSFRWCKPAFSPADAQNFADRFLASLAAVRAAANSN